MVPPLSALSLALCHEALEGGGNQQIRKKKLPLLLTPFAIHCLTKATAFVPQCEIMEPSTGNQQMGTIKWEPFFLPLLLISFAIHCLAALPNARMEPGDETIKWEPFFLPLLLISFAIHCLAALPNALVVPYCHSLVSRNCITIYGAKPIYAPENLDSFASLTLYARFARYPNSLPA